MSRLKGADFGSVASGAASRYVVSPRSGEGQYTTTGTNDHTVINQALTDASTAGSGRPGVVLLMEGLYTLGGPIVLPDNPNVGLRGVGKDKVQLKANLTTNSVIKRASTGTTRFKYEISGLTVDNTSKSNANAIGLDLDNLSNCVFRDVVVTNVATAVRLQNSAYFNTFENVDIEEATTGFWLTGGTANNENRFLNCKAVKAAGGVGVDAPVLIDVGNDNHFFACSFEDFVTAIEISDIGNHFISCRIEGNRGGSPTYIKLNAGAHNNTFVSPYFSGSDWVSRTTSIVDNGSGNAIMAFSTFKDQFFTAERNLLTADDMVYMKRSGSGDQKSIYTAEDTYTPSGIPVSYTAKQVRDQGKFFSGIKSGTEMVNFDQYGIAFPGGAAGSTGMAVDNQWAPNQYSFKSWAYDPIGAVNSSVPTGGTVNVIALRANRATSITHAYMYCAVVGNGTTNCYCALYSSSGTFLAQSNDQSGNMASTGLKTFTFTTTPVGPGWFYLAFWATATTTVPAFARAAGVGVINAGLSTANLRYATADTLQTTTAPSPLGARTTGAIAYWAAVD